MTRTIRYGLIGAGMMGLEHLRNLALTPDAEVTALADPVATSLEAARATIGGRWKPAEFADAAALAASGLVDAVIVASPNHTHRRVLEPLFDAGLHILCEKPMATTLPDARWVAARAGRYERTFWVGMEYRYMPPAAEFIRQVHAGRAGALRMLSIREHRYPFQPKVGDWNRFNENTGGTMVEKCCHFFDLMRLIVRAEPVQVYCSGAMDVNHLDERYGGRQPDIIDNSYTIVDFANGVRAMLDLCMFADGPEEEEEISAVGDAARLDVTVPGGAITYSPRVGRKNPKRVERQVVAVEESALKAGAHFGSTLYQHAHFAAAVRGDGPVQGGADDGLRAVAIGVAAEISAREKRAVAMAELGF